MKASSRRHLDLRDDTATLAVMGDPFHDLVRLTLPSDGDAKAGVDRDAHRVWIHDHLIGAGCGLAEINILHRGGVCSAGVAVGVDIEFAAASGPAIERYLPAAGTTHVQIEVVTIFPGENDLQLAGMRAAFGGTLDV